MDLTAEILITLRTSGPITAAEIKAEFDVLFRLKARERTWPLVEIERELATLAGRGRAEALPRGEWRWLPEAPPPPVVDPQRSLF